WNAGKENVRVSGPGDAELDALLARADVVVDTPTHPGAWRIDPARAPHAVWVSVTPFGLDGPRASWRASDLGVMAASGNMFCTGDPDRAPVRCTEPSGYAHSAPEAAFAALTALASGRPQRVDLSMQEVVLIANMTAPANYRRPGSGGRVAGRTSAVRARSGRRSTATSRSACAGARHACRASRRSRSSSPRTGSRRR